MDQTKKLCDALVKNANSPTLAWHLFKRVLFSSSPSDRLLQPVLLITRILLRSNMIDQIDPLQQLLLSRPAGACQNSLLAVIRLMAKSGHVDKAFSLFQSFRAHFPSRLLLASLYNLLIGSSLRENRTDYVSWLCEDMICAGVYPETYTFNLMIRGLCDSGYLDYARKLFDEMLDKGCQPNEFSYGILIRGYCRSGLAERGVEFLDTIKRMGMTPNSVIYNTLISTFCNEGKSDEAENLVERMREDGLAPDVVTFNSRIASLCNAGMVLEASRIFRDMQNEALGLPHPNFITFNHMLEGFSKQGTLEEAESLVESMKIDGNFNKVESYNTWLSCLLRNGKLLESGSLLREMLDRGIKPNIYSYNILMDGLCKNGMLVDARMLLGLMSREGVAPDAVTYSSLLHGYCRKGRLSEANNILIQMLKSDSIPNTYTCNILLHGLWKEGKVQEAEKLFQKMNERNYCVDNVTCNIVIGGLCRSGKVEKAISVMSEMWTHGSAALAEFGNSFIGLVDDGAKRTKCLPDIITYSTIINGLCKDGKFSEAKNKFIEMMGKNIYPDSVIFDILVRTLCEQGKVSAAFQVLKDMEKKGCSMTLQTYNSLMLGLGSKSQIFEMYGLMDEMRENGISPNVCTYNYMISCLCEGGRTEDATSLFNEMIQNGITPNIVSFKLLIEAFCRTGEFRPAHEVFDISLSICGHKEALYSCMFNELLSGKEFLEAKELFKEALHKGFFIGNFLYKDLIEGFCKDENLEAAIDVLKKMMLKRYGFDPASFMPVIDGLRKAGNKHETDELAQRMLEMASGAKVTNKVCQVGRKHGKSIKQCENTWQAILHRNDDSGIAIKLLRRLEKGWGQGSALSLQPRKDSFYDGWVRTD